MIVLKFKPNSWIARLAAAKLKSKTCAVTIGRCIYLHNATVKDLVENEAWYRHELAHVMQYRKYGLVGFLFKYMWYSIQYGYYNNPLEVEARDAEQNHDIALGFLVDQKYMG